MLIGNLIKLNIIKGLIRLVFVFENYFYFLVFVFFLCFSNIKKRTKCIFLVFENYKQEIVF